MKQNFYIEKKSFVPNGQNLQETLAGLEKTTHQMQPTAKESSAALLMNKTPQHLGRDGPPGRARSPGVSWIPGEPRGLFPSFYSKIIHSNFINNKFYHLQTINFLIMKKQFLFLALFVLALIAGTSTAFGQLLPGVTISTGTQPLPPLTCAGNANFLHPMAGQSYTYTMDGATGTEDVSQWTWFATKDPSFIATGTLNTANSLTTASGDLLVVGANYGTPAATNSIDITWSSKILTNTLYQGAPSTTVFPSPTFVVGYGTGANCADNIKVYEINPIINFTIDIANIDPVTNTTMAWDAPTSQCVSKVVSATYVDATNDLLMNYGTNTLYFEVAAANFNTDFTPTFTLISGLNTVQSAVVTLHNSYTDAVAGTLSYAGATNTWATGGAPWATGHQFTAASAANVSSGVSLFVKVVITNSTEESLLANPFVLAVDARDKTNTGIWDMENEDCTYTVLLDVADQVDRATHTINPRPTIVGSGVPDSNVAAPNNIVPKNP